MKRGVLFAALLAGCQGNAAGAASPKIRVSSTLNCGRMLNYVRPAYPMEAREKRIQGVVRLRIAIAKSGEIRIVQALHGDPLLIPAAISAVKRWRYAPCLLDGQAQERKVEVDIDFTLNQ